MIPRDTGHLFAQGFAFCFAALDRAAGAQVTAWGGGAYVGPAGADPSGRGPC